MTVGRYSPEPNRVEAEVVGVVVGDEPYVKIGLPQIFDSLQRVAEGNQRLEAKVDTALSTQTMQMNHLSQQQSRLEIEFRTGMDKQELGLKNGLEKHEKELDKVTERLNAVEAKPVVTPKAMWAGVGTIIAAVGAGAGIISIIAR